MLHLSFLDVVRSKFGILPARQLVFPFLAMDAAVDGFCPQAGLFNHPGHNRVEQLSSSCSPLL